MLHTIYAANGKVSHIHRRMCYWDYTEWITRSFVNKAKEGGHVRIEYNILQERLLVNIAWTIVAVHITVMTDIMDIVPEINVNVPRVSLDLYVSNI
jgi:hypothetical protein